MRYKLKTGSFAWLVHRSTGVLLTLYIFVHLYVLSHLRDPAEYAALLDLMKNPLVRLSEIGLLALVISHALNGLRLVLIDIGAPTKYHKLLFWTGFAVGLATFLAGAWVILGGKP